MKSSAVDWPMEKNAIPVMLKAVRLCLKQRAGNKEAGAASSNWITDLFQYMKGISLLFLTSILYTW